MLSVIAVSLAGALGTLARYGVNPSLQPFGAGFSWATFALNVAGSLLLAVGTSVAGLVAVYVGVRVGTAVTAL